MKIIAIGRNYRDHALELNNPVPKEPVVFLKPDTSIIKGNKPFYLPEFSHEIHHEVEVVIRICRVGKHIEKRFAYRYFDQLTVGIDFTARDIQKEAKKRGLPWALAKAFDGSAPLGNFRACDLYPDVTNLDFGLTINDNRVQAGNTREMIFPFDDLIAFVSRYFTLQIGDLIFTGTPAGVGPVSIGDHLKADLAGETLLECTVR